MTENAPDADVVTVLAKRHLGARHRIKNLWDALTDGLVTILLFIGAFVTWLFLDLGPAVAVSYLNIVKMWELLWTKDLGALTWGELGTLAAILVVGTSAWLRFAKDRRDIEDWKKVIGRINGR